MPIFSLTPLVLDNPNCEASSHRGRAIVRAKNEHEARAVAAQVFDETAGCRRGEGVRLPPWIRPILDKAELVNDPRFDGEGAPAVLEPSV